MCWYESHEVNIVTNQRFFFSLGVSVSERQVWVCFPGQEEPQTDQLDCAVQTQAQEGPVCKYWVQEKEELMLGHSVPFSFSKALIWSLECFLLAFLLTPN